MNGNPLATLLFWVMLPIGGVGLAASLVLPAWFEYQEARAALALAQAQQADLARRVATVERQIEHLQDDEAYIRRIVRHEFGIEAPGVAPLEVVVPPPAPALAPALEQEALAALPDDGLGAMSDWIRTAVREYPLLAVFVLDETRPIIMIIAAVLVVSAIVLLCRSTTSRAAAADRAQET